MKVSTIVASAIVAVCAIAAAPAWERATAPRAWSFPRDHGRHDGFKIEWWYFTGNCADAAGQRFGYELTFFRSALDPRQPTSRPSRWAASDLYFAHAAVTDVNDPGFVARDRLGRARPGVAWASDRSMDVSLLDWSCRQDGGGAIHLLAIDPALSIDLSLTGGRGPFLEGPGGVNVKGAGEGHASYYATLTRLRTVGTLGIDGRSYRMVDGQTWMDHEFSTDSLRPDQVGWDWFGLQLDDGTDLMIYRMRNRAGGTDHLSGTRVTPDGVPHYLGDRDITLSGDDPWTSPTSHAAYPQRWRVTIDGRTVAVRSRLATQELSTSASAGVTYWEGAVGVNDAAGKPVGQGYLEMTGYAAPVTGAK